MPRHNKKAKRAPDSWSKLAKEQGYRSRAAYKLIQLNKKHDLLSSARVIIDLCAAPGGWLQVAQKYSPVSSIVIGVDLVPIKSVGKAITLEQDITTPQCRTALRKHLKHFKADIVLHDGAPNMGMAWLQDAYTQSDLVLKSLTLAVEFLRPGGSFCTKVFRSKDYTSLLYVFNQLFHKVEATKPVSSRNTSAEIFVICKGFKDVDVDPKLLDPQFVFKDVDNLQGVTKRKLPDAFLKKVPRPSREGYEEGLSTLHKACSVADFISSESPVQMLAEYYAFTFDAKAAPYARRASEEIRKCCEDLKVLNKKDLKGLLKWRNAMRNLLLRHMSDDKEDDVADEDIRHDDGDDGVDDDGDDDGDDDDDATSDSKDPILKDIALALDAEQKRKKRERKRANKKRAKAMRKAMLGIGIAPEFQVAEDEDLFAIEDTELIALDDGGNGDMLAGLMDESDDGEQGDVLDEEEDEEDEEDYEDWLEQNLDYLYQEYSQATAKRQKAARKRKEEYQKRVEEEAEDLSNVDGGDVEALDDDGAEDEEAVRVRERLAEVIGETDDPEREAEQLKTAWFGGDMFGDEDGDGDESSEDEDERDGWESSDEEKSEANDGSKAASNVSGAEDFEVVPQQSVFPQHTGSSDDEVDDDEGEEYSYEDETVEDKAVTLAYAKAMMTGGKKRRREMLDYSFNRYTFGDRASHLPEWFAHDEARHMKPQMPITREEYAEAMARFNEVNARPIKKVAEAKARKRRKAQRQTAKMRNKASEIANSAALSDKEKLKAISSMYKKVDSNSIKPVYLVQSKGTVRAGKQGKYRKGRKVKMVDKRMKSDKAAEKRREKKRGKKRGR